MCVCVCVTMITTNIQTGLWAVRHKENTLLDVYVFLFCSVHALIQLAEMQAYLSKNLERAFFDDLGGSIAFDEKVASL